MRALLDESLPRRLARAFEGIEVQTVFDHGWQGLTNGVLLGKAASDFDVFITADHNLRYQQNLAGFEIGVVVLAAVSNLVDVEADGEDGGIGRDGHGAGLLACGSKRRMRLWCGLLNKRR